MSYDNEIDRLNDAINNVESFSKWHAQYKNNMARNEFDIEKAEPISIDTPAVNLETVYDIKNVTSTIIKEIDHNKAIIDALIELKAQVLTLKDQKRDIIELRDDINNLFIK
ncbi:Hypothetical protein PACV_31 [Pacmanvirus A23]|uniref:Hypothetical protein n=1 Tax=Pacmanvirus A23 TaxID=1932881 RepID=UPI000A0954FD|nr:Hypothetical protein B9W72_gp031 [Pacmanvirus A23]SIP85748.1 Hypothetical protein PACV_31 [Pacmanvirus A23]